MLGTDLATSKRITELGGVVDRLRTAFLPTPLRSRHPALLRVRICRRSGLPGSMMLGQTRRDVRLDRVEPPTHQPNLSQQSAALDRRGYGELNTRQHRHCVEWNHHRPH